MVVATDDPIILAYWLRNYESLVAESVDELLLAVNGPHADEVEVSASKLRLFRYPHANDHGWCLQQMYPYTTADAILFSETDAWVRATT